ACMQINPGIIEYAPNVALWADTASKRRWVYLPPGTQIDTSDMNHWMFPQGFKAWKEFTRDGVRVETRLIEKIGPGDAVADWFYVGSAGTAARAAAAGAPLGGPDATGTMPDFPSQQLCRPCHEELAPSRILGIQAIQLDGATPVGVDDLASMSLLSA